LKMRAELIANLPHLGDANRFCGYALVSALGSKRPVSSLLMMAQNLMQGLVLACACCGVASLRREKSGDDQVRRRPRIAPNGAYLDRLSHSMPRIVT